MKSHNIKYIFIGAFFAFTCCIIVLSANAQIVVGQGEGSAWTATGPTSNNDTLHQNMDIPGYNYVGKTADGRMVWERLDPVSTGGSTPKTDDQNPDITNTDADCAVKQVGEDYVRCCKDEIVTPPTKDPTSTPQVTTGNGNENGCGNQCHTSCSNYGGTVYTVLGSWTGGTIVSPAKCRDGCYCIKGASSGGVSANPSGSDNSSGLSTTELTGQGSGGGNSGFSGGTATKIEGNITR